MDNVHILKIQYCIDQNSMFVVNIYNYWNNKFSHLTNISAIMYFAHAFVILFKHWYKSTISQPACHNFGLGNRIHTQAARLGHG